MKPLDTWIIIAASGETWALGLSNNLLSISKIKQYHLYTYNHYSNVKLTCKRTVLYYWASHSYEQVEGSSKKSHISPQKERAYRTPSLSLSMIFIILLIVLGEPTHQLENSSTEVPALIFQVSCCVTFVCPRRRCTR